MKRLHPPGCTLLPSQDADVLLLDDCLAAVDAKVAAWILRHALLGPLLWAPPAGAATAKQQQQQPPAQHQQESRQRTVIVATHSPELLAAADLVVEMQGGAVAALRQQPGAAQRRAQAAAETAAAATAEGGEGAPPSQAAAGVEQTASGSGTQPGDAQHPPQQAQLAEEERQTGHVRWAVYRRYAAATGWGWVALILGSLLLMQVSRDIAESWGLVKVQSCGWGEQQGCHRQHAFAQVKLCGSTMRMIVCAQHCSESKALLGIAGMIARLFFAPLLQATRNGNDLWLSRWVSHTPSAAPPAAMHQQQGRQQWEQQRWWRQRQWQPAEQLHLEPTAGARMPAVTSWWCGATLRPGVPLPACAVSAAGSSGWEAAGNASRSDGVLAPGQRRRSSPSTGGGRRRSSGGSDGTGSTRIGRQPLDPTVRFYLTGLLIIAGANSVITLIRAFSFAKGGLVAAQVRCWWVVSACRQFGDGCWLQRCACNVAADVCYSATIALSTSNHHSLLQRVHNHLLASVLGLPLAFFDATPSGRILNRFSSDTGVLPLQVPLFLLCVLACFAT